MPHRILSLGLIALVGGCALSPATVTYQELDRDAYSPSVVNAAALDGKLPAAVVGAPFPGVGPAAALAPLELPFSVAPRGLVEAPGAATRVVLLFHPLSPIGNQRACGPLADLAPVAGAPADAGPEFAVIATLCQYHKALSTARSSGPRPAGLSDPLYAELVEAALLEIMPLPQPEPAEIDIPIP
ncbi:hypothetical protein D3874_11075 [Oleomonas cavernae]|uniref:Lipoprotein n=1 Tax=Oleomonas cavernae TaxID=2320859 RepID=A0A418WBW3_9PROT|nr:hypothetical protein [Oleomonas cavernae]RJF87492.1 hypothetical protein D3874_11075 [Oleomonas cavernae]